MAIAPIAHHHMRYNSAGSLATHAPLLNKDDAAFVVTAGELLVARVEAEALITVPPGWTSDATARATGTTDCMIMWKISDGTETAISIAVSTAAACSIDVSGYSGASPTPFDAAASANTSSAAPATGTIAALAQADEYACAMWGHGLANTFTAYNKTGTATISGVFTEVSQGQGLGAHTNTMAAADAVITATGTLGATATTANGAYQGVIVAFKAQAVFNQTINPAGVPSSAAVGSLGVSTPQGAALYRKGAEAMLSQSPSIRLTSDTIRASIGRSAAYTPDLVGDVFLTDVIKVADSAALTGKTVASGVFNADPPQFAGIAAGANLDFVVLWKDTGTPSTSPLIAYIPIVAVAPDGLRAVLATWDAGASKIFAL